MQELGSGGVLGHDVARAEKVGDVFWVEGGVRLADGCGEDFEDGGDVSLNRPCEEVAYASVFRFEFLAYL